MRKQSLNEIPAGRYLPTDADKTKLDGIATNANNYTHPNHTGDVTSTGDGATVIAANVVTNAKLAQVATSTLKGRVTAAAGNVEDLTAVQVRTIINVEDGAQKNSNILKSEIEAVFTGNITTHVHNPAIATPAFATAMSLDLNTGNVIEVTLTGNITSFALTNGVVGRSYRVRLTQDAIGSRTFPETLPAGITLMDGLSKIVLSTTANVTDVLEAYVVAANTYELRVVGYAK